MGRHLLHFTRNCLSAESIRAFLCLGDWGRRDLIDMKDIMEAVDTKRKRKQRDLSDAEEEDGGDVNHRRVRRHGTPEV